MTVPNQFASRTTAIPLSELDANFNTPITIGNTPIQLGNTVTTLNNMTLANVTVSSYNASSAVTPEANGGTGTTTGYYGFKNRIINGAMMIDQRNAGAAVTITNTSNLTYVLDRFGAYGSQASKLSVQQNKGSITPPAGFKNYMGISVAATATVGSTDSFSFSQPIEGFNTADLGWGAAGAATVTLSFWVYSNITGTFGGCLRNSSANRSYVYSYTINSANTWEYKTITVPGDTTGTWEGATNGIGMTVLWGIGQGSSISASTGWQAGNYLNVTGGTSLMGSTSNYIYITGVQLEKGSTATSFDYRPYGTELALCQRYYETCFSAGTAPANGVSDGRVRFLNMSATQTNDVSNNLMFSVAKRAAPTMTQYASVGNTTGGQFDNVGTQGGTMFATLGANAVSFSHWTASSEL